MPHQFMGDRSVNNKTHGKETVPREQGRRKNIHLGKRQLAHRYA